MAHATVESSVETNKQSKTSASENVACKSMDHTPVSGTTQPLPPDGGWGYVVVLASFLIHIVTDGMTYSFGVFYLELLYYFEEGKGATAWIASILVGITLCSGPISGSFVNKYGCRTVTIVGSILASSCLLASVWARNIVTLYFTIGIGTGLGFGLIYLPAIVSVTCYFEKYRSLATGIAVCGSGLGTLIFAPCLEYLIAMYGWRGTIMICSGIVLNCIVFGALFRPLEANKVQKRSSAENSSKKTPRERSDSSLGVEGTKIHTVSFQKANNSSDLKSALSQPVLISKVGNNHADSTTPFGNDGVTVPHDALRQESMDNVQKLPRNFVKRHSEEMAHVPESCTSLPSKTKCTSVNNSEFKVCIKEKRDIFHEMLDISMLKDPVFILFIFSNFCTSIGFYVPYVYVLPQAEERGINKKEASYLLAVIGIANTVGRIVLGYMSDKPWINRLLTYNLCLTICGISTILSTFCTSFGTFAFYSSVFGFTSGAYVGLTSVILVDLLGLSRLTNAFGLLLLFQGFASLLGPPIAGWLYDALKSYNPGFLTAGGMITVSGLVLFFIPFIRQKARQNVNNQKAKTIINNELV